MLRKQAWITLDVIVKGAIIMFGKVQKQDKIQTSLDYTKVLNVNK